MKTHESHAPFGVWLFLLTSNIMKAKHLLVLLLLVFVLPRMASAQTPANGNGSTQVAPVKAAIGTYQFQITQSKSTPVFSDEILVEVELKRQETETVYLTLSPGVVVMIPSRNAINDPAFVPLEEVVYQ